MFRFGWLTVTAEDLTIWKQFPAAAFTLVSVAPSEDGEEYRLGSFDVGSQPRPAESS
jgi:hypothetical protein